VKKICPICKNEYGAGEVFCPVDAARLITGSQLDAGDADDHEGDALIGTTLDKYDVKRRIGEGGMGLVYEAVHNVIEKRVAIKVLREDFSRRAEVVERFRQEAKSASRIGHEHIVDISDFGETPQGASYFVMEYLDGEDLAGLLGREGTLDPGRAVSILLQCCKALGAAHSKGIVHRDMKPENIFLTKRDTGEDFVKIVDFGIAKMSDIETEGEPGRKLTKTGMIFGTPEYMSPEQAAGKNLDHRVDIYAMGVILYELLTGRVPFVGDSFMGILTQHMFEEAPPLRETNPHVECSAELEMVIFKALAKNPDDRYQTMDELAEGMLEAMQGRVSNATLMGYGEPVKSKAGGPRAVRPLTAADEFPSAQPTAGGSNKGLIAAALLLLVVGGGAGAFFALKGGDEQQARADVPEPDPVGSEPDPVEPVEQPIEPVEPVETQMVEQVEEPAVVPVTIQTPGHEGAEVSVEGDGVEGCEPTPCTIEVPPGAEIVVHARHGRFRGSTTLTPETALTTQILLRARRVRMDPNTAADETPMMDMSPSTMMGGDLKVPEILFQ